MSTLKDSKYDGNGGLWRATNNPKIALQGSIQIGGRKIAITVWKSNRPAPAPDYNITVNTQQTNFEDMVWFKSLGEHQIPRAEPSNALIDAARGREVLGKANMPDIDDDIPF